MNAFWRMMDLPAGYWLAALLLGLAVWLWKRRAVPALLAAYAFYVLSLAVLSRVSTPEPRCMLRLFWSYEAWPEGWEQVAANVAVFVPLGFLLGLRIGWRGLPVGAGFSLLIELLQLILHRGVFEFDDIFHNSLGALLGVTLAIRLRRLREGGPRG